MKNQNGGSLAAVIIIALIVAILASITYSVINTTIKKSESRRVLMQVLNIAEAGKEDFFAKVKSFTIELLPNQTISPLVDIPFSGGTYTVSCSTNVSLDTVWITSISWIGNVGKKLSIKARVAPLFPLNIHGINGAVTARSNIITYGNVIVDGRDHDTSWNLNGLPGIDGVWTCGTVYQWGASTIGGNGLIPIKEAGDDRITQFADPTSFPPTPEDLVGLPAGALDGYKVDALPIPFHGLYYLTKDYVGPLNVIKSSGVLIVHNSSKTAELKITSGEFKGLIITDKMDKVTGNSYVLGSVVTLTDAEVSTFGVGFANVFYCSSVLNNLDMFCKNLHKTVRELEWKEETIQK
jgi:Tfp pilus assembly protein PilE